MVKRRGGDYSSNESKAMKRFLLAFAAISIACICASFIPTERPVTKASAVVYIDMGAKPVIDPDDGSMHVQHAHGTGISIGNGYVLTAAHVGDSDEGFTGGLAITDSLGRKHTAEMLWANHKYDVALLRMSDPANVAADNLSCRLLDKGERLTFAGNPYDLHDITTWGTVASGKIQAGGPWGAINIVNAAIDPGMSGGPVFDRGHNLVGINVGTIQGSGLGMIVPGHVICGLMDR